MNYAGSCQIKDLFTELKSTESGLSALEATKRLQLSGSNVILQKGKHRAFKIFLEQFQNWLIITLVIATCLAFFLGEKIDATVILFLIFLSTSLGFFQEYRAERVLVKLRKYITHKAKVLRDGLWVEIDSKHIVTGDIVQLRIGDRVPADVRLFQIDGFTTDESILTGESMPVQKTLNPINKEFIQPQKLTNMAFMSTFVTAGIAQGIVTATGAETILGQTAKDLEKENPPTEFQRETKQFGLLLFRVMLVLATFIFAANGLLGKGLLNSLLFALALAVGITPELLPIITTVTLAQGALLLAKKKVIVKKLMSVEDLGNIDTLCADKTGTLTEGHFSFVDYQSLEGAHDRSTLEYAFLCSSFFAGKTKGIVSNPTDQALYNSKEYKLLENEIEEAELLDVNEFDYERKRMGVIVQIGLMRLMIVKGAPENVFSVCTNVRVNTSEEPLTEKVLQELKKKVAGFEKDGYRVLAVAHNQTLLKSSDPKDEKNLIFDGFLLFNDPIKKTVSESIQLLRNLGVTIKIISGDSPIVVNKVAKDTHLISEDTEIITGDDLINLNDENFEIIIRKHNLFARVTPEQKRQIVASLNKEGHIVGFLGDGVNDASALKAADVGIAVDTGEAVAKEAADIILLRKDLKILVDGIENGRKTFGNITKYILNTCSANYGNMFTVAVSSLFLKFIPLLPAQILLTNFISDIPLLTIATDNVDRDFTSRPRRWNIKFIFHFMLFFGFISSFFDLALIFPMIFFWKVDPSIFRTAWFIESALSEIMVTFAIRTQLPFYKSKPSKWLILASILSGMSILIIPFLVFGQTLFSFVQLPSYIWFWVIIILTFYFIVTELGKKYFFRNSKLSVLK